ncbi:hypothetical protein LTS08_007237 [Lithohypha guttulata]|uniref:Uncharacterized protein n=1 Tax=Lithohypha guttulata TaxID=1690604 RepID=A0AAN7T2Z8_9EURO|nr:hypothetical protein LTR05_003992 [Lithohypha guttulata]KAK5097216.1 hypothetical protein LTS08_007237 [Lithohypha guttulata]
MAEFTMSQSLAIDQIPDQPGTFVSRTLPQRLGNSAPIAYGGCTAGLAVHSACKTIDKPNFHIYSVLGTFLGPTRIDRHVTCRVTRTRDTKTFCTRRVVASQEMDDGSERTCLDIFVNFHVLEPELLRYSASPMKSYGAGPEDPAATTKSSDLAHRLVKEGHIPQTQADKHTEMFALSEKLIETRHCLAGVSGQNFSGLAKNITTTQHQLSIPERTSAEWMRLRRPLSNEAEYAAALAFIMDGALSFLPLNLDKKNFDDVGACSTLDFALRIMVPGFKLHKWHLRERRTIAAAVGRSYSESRLWDEAGNMVAVENQSCIARPRPDQAKARI